MDNMTSAELQKLASDLIDVANKAFYTDLVIWNDCVKMARRVILSIEPELA